MHSAPASTTIVKSGLIRVLALLCLCALPQTASAVQWQPLAGTGRHDVAIDMSSVRLTTMGRLAVWLRFTPVDDFQRRQAATEYGQKGYRLHLEYYELDCSELTSINGQVEILGPAGKRLARVKSNGRPEAIVPGSVLDLAARTVCPSLEEAAAPDEDEVEAPDSGAPPEEVIERHVPDDVKRLIEDATRLTEQEPDNVDSWRKLGNAYFDADMPTESIAAYDRALALAPNDTNILNDQGAMYRQKSDFSRALANFEKARTVDPNNLESLYNIGYVLAFDLNQIDKAVAVWKSYLALDQYSETAHQVQSFVDRYSKGR